MAQTEVKVGTFSPNVLLRVAVDRYREVHKLDLEEELVASSRDQFVDLINGRYDAIVTSPDNYLAYSYEKTNPLKTLLDVEIVGPLDRGLGLGLFARKGFASDGGKSKPRLAVDVPNSGFAFIAYEMLEQMGYESAGYQIVPMGATRKRARALLNGNADYSILYGDEAFKAESLGCERLLTFTDTQRYVGAVLVVQGEHRDRPVIRRLYESVRLVASRIETPENLASVREFASNQLKLNGHQVQRFEKFLLDPKHGVVRDGVFDDPAWSTLLRLRAKYEGLPQALSDGTKSPKGH